MSLGIIYKDKRQIFREIEKEAPYLEYPLLTDNKNCASWIFNQTWWCESRMLCIDESEL